MSPVSRGRKKAKSRRSDLRLVRPVVEIPEDCDCPACSGEELDLESLLEDLTAGAADLLAIEDPLEAELFGVSLMTAGEWAEGLTEALVPALAQLSNPESAGMLLAIAAADGGAAAASAARDLLAAGVPAPAWADELAEPVRAGLCRRYGDPAGEASMLVCTFERAGRSHGFVIHVDHLERDAAVTIVLFPGEVLDQVTAMIEADGRRAGLRVRAEELAPGDLRWQVERALDARAVHDLEIGEPDLDDDLDDGPGYHPLAALLRARMAVLPEPVRPPAPHGSSRKRSSKMPAKRKKSDGPAPIYQIKVSLFGAKPSIWRRLELPGDTGLADLHHIIQGAFGWDDNHLHVFETPYGVFGIANRELGHRAEKPVTLEQIAPATRDKVVYLYDFGDNWEHEIVVEKLLDRQAVTYPRCTGGRRAAPPDDCGGIWGYTELVEILSDPGHPEHEERLEWLGLRSAGDFEPDRFDAAEVTRALLAR